MRQLLIPGGAGAFGAVAGEDHVGLGAARPAYGDVGVEVHAPALRLQVPAHGDGLGLVGVGRLGEAVEIRLFAAGEAQPAHPEVVEGGGQRPCPGRSVGVEVADVVEVDAEPAVGVLAQHLLGVDGEHGIGAPQVDGGKQ